MANIERDPDPLDAMLDRLAELDRGLAERDKRIVAALRAEVERLRQQHAGAVEALEQARDLVAEAYSDDEHDDSPGNMAYAVLNAALNRFGGQ
jgi:hypothetical protein